MNVLLLDKTKKLELVKGEVKHADVVTVKGKGYKIIADAVTYLVKERLFGFLPPKIQPTFFGLDSDSALLILDNETLRIDKSFFDIEDAKNVFKKKQLTARTNALKNNKGNNELFSKIFIYVIGLEFFLIIFLSIPIIIPALVKMGEQF